MKKILIFMIFSILIHSSNLMAANPMCNIFCCTNVTNVIHPVETDNAPIANASKYHNVIRYHDDAHDSDNDYGSDDYDVAVILRPVRTIQNFDITRLNKGQKSQTAAQIKALRLIAIIEHEDLIHQNNYIELENHLYAKTREFKINRPFLYLCRDEKTLPKIYSLYSNSNENLPGQTLKTRNDNLINKKLIHAQIQAARLMTIIDNDNNQDIKDNKKLMHTQNYYKLEKLTKTNYKNLAHHWQKETLRYPLASNYAVYTDQDPKNFLHTKLTLAKENNIAQRKN